jgi:hypothetical protein
MKCTRSIVAECILLMTAMTFEFSLSSDAAGFF